jgi:uncharacterized protein (DUF488 family)
MVTTLYTVGHSTRSIDALLELLAESKIAMLVDVRAFPRSRRHPQFNRDALERALAARGIGYAWLGKALGGFREPRPDSRHLAFREPAFRGFADHMETAAFDDALSTLLLQASRERTAVMCAERDPAQCHRGLIADAALVRGARVVHLIAPGECREAALAARARLVGRTLVYDGGQPPLIDDS